MKQNVETFAGSFDDLTQGDIVDYYTMVSPSGEYPGSQTLQRKGSPGVWVPPGIDHALVSYSCYVKVTRLALLGSREKGALVSGSHLVSTMLWLVTVAM